MADDNAAELIKRGNRRFSARQQLDGFRQEVALNFAPYLARWTGSIQWGEDFASHLVDGTPLLLARDFVGQIGAMLRPPGKQYFWHRTPLETLNADRDVRAYLDWRSGQMMRIMTDRITGFTRATKEADEFFAMFGDAVLSVDTSEMQDSLRIRNWHSADCVWAIGSENKPDVITRKEMVPARVMIQRFGDKKVHEKVKRAAEKDGDTLFEIRHEVLPASEYDSYSRKGNLQRRHGFSSVWVDVENKTILREASTATFRYVIPRWVTLSGQPYAISPATTIALPDARLLQQQAVAILEAAEKQVDPPIVAQADAIRGDVSMKARSINWVDREYDERHGDAVRVLEMGKNFALGVDALMRTEHQLTRAFYLDTLRMPDTRGSKSTLEVQFKIDEYVRAALPLFAPMQDEYSCALFEEVDTQIDALGGYGAMDKPQALADLKTPFVFQWNNPLSDMIERQKAQTVSEVSVLGQAIVALEQASQQSPALRRVDTEKMFVESAMGIGGSNWMRSEKEAKKLADADAKAAQMQQMVAAAPNVAKMIDSGVNAAQAASEIPAQGEPGFALPAPM